MSKANIIGFGIRRHLLGECREGIDLPAQPGGMGRADSSGLAPVHRLFLTAERSSVVLDR